MRKLATFVLILGFWFGCGHIARGYWIGEFTVNYPDQEQERSADVHNYLFGPVALVGTLITGGFAYPYMEHGYTCQQRWDAFKESGAEILGKKYFVHWGGNQLCNIEDLR